MRLQKTHLLVTLRIWDVWYYRILKNIKHKWKENTKEKILLLTPKQGSQQCELKIISLSFFS